jgi:MFS family permease
VAASPSGGAGAGDEGPARGLLSAFGYGGYRRLWTGAFVSSIGTWTQDVALAWLIHTRLKDPVYLGLRSFAAEAPLLAFMLVGGAVADRVDRRRILLASQTLQMLYALALLALYATDRLGIGGILGIAFLTGLTQSQSAPTYQAVLTTIVPPRQIPNAVALNSLQFNLSRAIGPAIAALILTHGGTGVCFGVNAVSFLAVIAAIRSIEMPAPAPAAGQTLGQSLLAGLRHVGADPVLARLMLLGAAGSFLGFPLITYLPVIAGDVLRTGAAGYSLLLSSFGAGAIAGALATAWRGYVAGRGRTALVAAMLYGVATIGAVGSRWQGLSMALLFVSGMSLVSCFSILNSLVQEQAPDALRGRVLSIWGLFFRGGMPTGSLVAGFFMGRFGAPAVLGLFCAVLVLLAGGFLACSRTLRTL